MVRHLILSCALFVPTLATAAACPEPLVFAAQGSSMVETTSEGLSIPLGGLTLQSIEPDEIDLASACVPQIVVAGLELQSIEPDEIDDSALWEIDGQVDLGGWVVVPQRDVLVTAGATLSWAPSAFALRVETSERGLTRVVMDVTLDLVAVDAGDARPTSAVLDATITLGEGSALGCFAKKFKVKKATGGTG